MMSHEGAKTFKGEGRGREGEGGGGGIKRGKEGILLSTVVE